MKNISPARGFRALRTFVALAIAATATISPAQVTGINPTYADAAASAATAAVSTPAAALAGAPLAAAATLPLAALVAMNASGAALDEQAHCLAVAVYHEARGETLEGQLAVADVVINRARSNRYPASWCKVVKQPAQFSFVRGGRFPPVDTGSTAWAQAQAIARIASLELASQVDDDVLWYHADYVAPSWGRRLTRVSKIGAHIFYRA